MKVLKRKTCYRKSRRHTSKQKRQRTQKKQRKQRKQNGGGYAYDIPPNAIVEHRSMDDDGTNPPMLMTKRAMDEMIPDSERA